MKINTSRFGEIELPDDTLITFPKGVVGFPEARGFVLFDCSDDGIFKWMQSVDVQELAFVICEASLVLPNYQIICGKSEQEMLKLSRAEDAAVCLILAIGANPADTTANLLGPIVMNAESRLGMQMVLVNPDYSTRHKIFADASGTENSNVSA